MNFKTSNAYSKMLQAKGNLEKELRQVRFAEQRGDKANAAIYQKHADMANADYQKSLVEYLMSGLK